MVAGAALVVGAITTAASAQTAWDGHLAVGDTSAAVAALRDHLAASRGSPPEQCLLASLLTSQVTSRHADWRVRLEAQQLFEASLRRERTPACLLAFAALKEKQGIRVDAGRLARQAFGLVASRPDAATPALLAEVYYRRVSPVADWVRNFDRLVTVKDLPVSTPGCSATGYFCESVLHPWLFLEKLERAEPLEGLVRAERRFVRALLDTALAHDPTHVGALRLALREAAAAGDWEHYARVAGAAHARRPDAAAGLLAVLSAEVQRNRQAAASAIFDTLLLRLGPEALGRYEGLALVVDTALRTRLEGKEQVVLAEAVWGLSDPLYLTPENERRLAHYARVYLADVLFSDPPAEVAGRDTPQGRLLIRYGFPERWFVVRADRSLELTDAQRQQVSELLACATTPTPGATPTSTGLAPQCGISEAQGQRMDAGGRWTFWFYDRTAPPFIFEQALGNRIASHKWFTESEHLDSLAHRTVPSTYTAPFASGDIVAQVTRFPRPAGPAVEVHARFRWSGDGPVRDSVRVGLFLHDPFTGRQLARSSATAVVTTRVTDFGGTLSVPWGRLRLVAEGLVGEEATAAQLRASLELVAESENALWLSDILLADSARGPDVLDQRDQATIWARVDSVWEPGARMALYWETYGFRGPVARYHVRLGVRDASNRPVVARVLRGFGQLFGAGRPRPDLTMEWDIERRVPGTLVAELLELTAPEDAGLYVISIEVREADGARVARTERVVEVAAPTRD
jgi:hypothetical protein